MKRRKFIQASVTGVAASAISTTVASSVVQSQQQPLNDPGRQKQLIGKICISRSGLPPEFWNANSSIAEILCNVRTDRRAQALLSDPVSYLRGIGVSIHSEAFDDESITLLSLSLDEDFQKAIDCKDYQLVLSYIGAAGTTGNFNSRKLQSKVLEILDQNKGELREQLELNRLDQASETDAFYKMATELNGSISLDDLSAIHGVFSANLSAKALRSGLAVSIAAIFVTAAAYVVVVVAVGAWVWVSGPGDEQSGNNRSQFRTRGRLSQIDPELVNDYERTLKISTLTGEPEIARQGFLKLIRAESEAVVGALRSCGYLSDAPSNDEDLVNAATHYAARVAGLA